MKASLAAGLTGSKTITVDEGRCISFMGREGMVYATPRVVSDVEYSCLEFLQTHLDAGEASVGTHVSIDHLAATPLGMQATVEFTITALEKRQVSFAFTVRDAVEECARGTHVRFVVDVAKTKERLAAKRAKAGMK